MFYAIVERIEEENIVQIIIDNAANFKAVGQLLMEKEKVVLDIICCPLY